MAYPRLVRPGEQPVLPANGHALGRVVVDVQVALLGVPVMRRPLVSVRSTAPPPETAPTGSAESNTRARGRHYLGITPGSTPRCHGVPRSASATSPPLVIDLPSPEHGGLGQRLYGS
jgi:hypothetical protein